MFDIDDTICRTINAKYSKSKPIKQRIKIVNGLYDEGYYIKIFTARYMDRNKDNIKLAKKQGYKTTYAQLKKWKIKFHKLIIEQIIELDYTLKLGQWIVLTLI